MAEKRYLFTPGPTPVPPEVLAALAEPVVHHRGARLPRCLRECLERLRAVYRTASDVLLFTSSGTGAMESAVANLCSPGDRVVVVSAGASASAGASSPSATAARSRRSLRVGRDTARGRSRRAKLDEVGGAKAVFLTHSETSTGVVADVQALAAAAKPSGAHVVVDAVSSLGAVPLETDAWGLDVVASGSQKALMTPPGARRSTRYRTRLWAPRAAPRRRASTSTGSGPGRPGRSSTSAFTPAVSLVAALNVALGLLLDEGLEAAFDRHIRLGRACREGAKAMGLELFSPDEDRRPSSPLSSPRKARRGRARLALRDRLRRHGRRRPGRPEGQDVPDRPHRLLRRLRHRDGARSRRARARRARRGRRARRRRRPRPRGVRATVAGRAVRRYSSASRSRTRAIELLRGRFDVDVDATPTSPRSSAATTGS